MKDIAILAVDDQPQNLLALSAVLEPLGRELVTARSGREALRQVLLRDFAVILLDVQMPEMDGYETATLIRARERSKHTPIVFLTAIHKDDSHVFRAHGIGAADYVFKPVNPEVLRAKVAVFLDLAEREAALEERARGLRASEEIYRTVVERGPVVGYMAEVAGDHRFMLVSEAVREQFGYEPRQLLADPRFWQSRMEPASAERAPLELATLLARGDHVWDYQVQAADGGLRWVQCRSTVLCGEDGAPERIVGFWRDMTPERTALAEHEQSAAITRFVADVGTMLSARTTADELLGGCVRLIVEHFDVSRAACWELSRASGELVLAAQAGEPVPPALGRIAAGQGAIGAAAAQGAPVTAPDDGAVLVAVPLMVEGAAIGAVAAWLRGSPVELVSRALGRVADTIAQSVARARKGAQLRELNTALERQAEELRSAKQAAERESQFKSAFLAGMSHELRTPLNAVIGFAELLDQDVAGALSPKQHDYARYVLQSGRHLLTLVNDILDLSKVEAGRMELDREPVEPAALLDAVKNTVQYTANRRGVRLTVEPAEGLPALTVDPTRVKQVLFNLVSNAIKFTPAGGSVRVVTQATPELVRFDVEDTGIGISATDLPRLFREFEQIHHGGQKPEGTGLGLALSKRLVEMHGGRISVQSTPGVGSRFTLELPRQPTPPSGAAPLAARAGPPTALVIEDDAQQMQLIATYVRAFGLRVCYARDAAQALRVADQVAPSVITLDILLPDQNGWAVLAELRAHSATATIPMVVVSVVDEPTDAAERGAGAYLTKPIDAPELAAAFERCGVPLYRVHGVRAAPIGRQTDELAAAMLALRHSGCAVLDAGSAGDPDVVVVDLAAVAPPALWAERRAQPSRVPVVVLGVIERVPDDVGAVEVVAPEDAWDQACLVRAVRRLIDARAGSAPIHAGTGLPGRGGLAAQLHSLCARRSEPGDRIEIATARVTLPAEDAGWRQRLAPMLTRSDAVYVAGPDRLALVCSESGRSARDVLQRLIMELGSDATDLRVARCPEDADTAGALLQRLEMTP